MKAETKVGSNSVKQFPIGNIGKLFLFRTGERVTQQTGMVIALVCLAVVLRVWGLTSLGFNSDEAVYSGQGAAIAQDPVLSEFFPVFRAHPLLFQYILSLVFQIWVADWVGRLMSVAFGVATVYTTYRLGSLLYGRRAGLSAALLLSIMPYHVVVTRQVLLDGPMTLFATLALFLLARFAKTQRPLWLFAASAATGLTFLAKETGILFLASIYIFLSLSPSIRLRFRDLILASAINLLVMLPYPLAVLMARGGGSANSGQYLIWQFFRRPNHDWDFYLNTVPLELGALVLFLAVFGLLFLRREKSWRETLLISWILVPVIFFQAWPTKGYQYLLPIAPPVALLAGRTLGRWFPEDQLSLFRGRWQFLSIQSLAISIVAVSLLIPTWQIVSPSPSPSFLAGSGGVPGGREAGMWFQENTPKGTTLMTIGPSMANILQFYGHRRAFGISVSPNPLYRNPSYQPINNPDLQIRLGEIQYIVWDAYSEARSSFFSEKLLGYVQKYHGRIVHVESVSIKSPGGVEVSQPVIIIYEVRP